MQRPPRRDSRQSSMVPAAFKTRDPVAALENYRKLHSRRPLTVEACRATKVVPVRGREDGRLPRSLQARGHDCLAVLFVCGMSAYCRTGRTPFGEYTRYLRLMVSLSTRALVLACVSREQSVCPLLPVILASTRLTLITVTPSIRPSVPSRYEQRGSKAFAVHPRSLNSLHVARGTADASLARLVRHDTVWVNCARPWIKRSRTRVWAQRGCRMGHLRGPWLRSNHQHEHGWAKCLLAELFATLQPKTSGPTPLPRIYTELVRHPPNVSRGRLRSTNPTVYVTPSESLLRLSSGGTALPVCRFGTRLTGVLRPLHKSSRGNVCIDRRPPGKSPLAKDSPGLTIAMGRAPICNRGLVSVLSLSRSAVYISVDCVPRLNVDAVSGPNRDDSFAVLMSLGRIASTTEGNCATEEPSARRDVRSTDTLATWLMRRCTALRLASQTKRKSNSALRRRSDQDNELTVSALTREPKSGYDRGLSAPRRQTSEAFSINTGIRVAIQRYPLSLPLSPHVSSFTPQCPMPFFFGYDI
ncbi:uncharacterized protein B0H18DRAFT_957303 [Fomitopsis serialis]|uniref:uncharacterized protein n=1 Tax=Fomitopsis serialis TaxID=139415 RepID=UPI0020074C12|nr:uncharacterized protein B0H18DRAFT_957303 [Neoantrodia serialis]KAH9919920.1 hypothetical protein B0H18DRAFT_957303 [Neoantrodia serialis]